MTPIDVATNMGGRLDPDRLRRLRGRVHPDGTTAWAVDTNVDNVVPMTVATGTPGTAVTVGNVPDGVAVTG